MKDMVGRAHFSDFRATLSLLQAIHNTWLALILTNRF